jgi:hypothetical protein
MSALESAVHGLRQAVDAPSGPSWRRAVRRQLALVRDALTQDQEASTRADGWLAARMETQDRARHHLLARVSAMRPKVRDRLEHDVPGDVRRLLCDLEHYLQRTHDLAYDAVALELGGSE